MPNRFLLSFLLSLLIITTSRAQVLDDVSETEVTFQSANEERLGKTLTLTSVSQPILASFTGVVFEIASTAESIQAAVRFEADGSWGPWIDLYSVRSVTEDLFVAGFHGETLRSGVRMEIRVSNSSSSPLTLRDAGIFDNRTDEDATSSALPAAPNGITGKKAGKIIPPALITRADWGASPFRGSPVDLARPTIDFLTFHHAAGFSATSREDGIRQVKAIQDFHQNIRGWSDIGYQFAIDRSGRLYQGRPFLDASTSLAQVPRLALGAHVGGHNTGNIGTVLLGCYHPPEGSFCEEVPTPEALATYKTLFAFLSERYHVAPTLIRGHRDFSATACPGDNNYVRLPQLRTDVARLLVTGNQSLGTASLTAVVDDEGFVRLSWEFLEDFGIDGFRLERTFQDRTDTITSGTGAQNGTSLDAGITLAGDVSYFLYAESADGRVQRLASLELTMDTPGEFLLARAFPNPASSRIQIRYFVAHKGVVHLNLFDATGRRVRSLDDSFRTEDRWYTSSLDVSGLPGGIYYYRLRIDGFSGIVFDKTRSIAIVR